MDIQAQLGLGSEESRIFKLGSARLGLRHKSGFELGSSSALTKKYTIGRCGDDGENGGDCVEDGGDLGMDGGVVLSMEDRRVRKKDIVVKEEWMAVKK